MIYKNYCYFCVVDLNLKEETRTDGNIPLVCSCHSQAYKVGSLYLKNNFCRMNKILNAVMPNEVYDANNITNKQLANQIHCINHCLDSKSIIEYINGVPTTTQIIDNEIINQSIETDKKILSNRNIIKKLIDKIKLQQIEIDLMKNDIKKLQSNNSLSESIDTTFF